MSSWKRPAVLALLLMLVTAPCGCGVRTAQGNSRRDAGLDRAGAPRTRTAGASNTVVPAEVIYAPGDAPGDGALETVAVQPGAKQRFMFLREWVRKDDEGRSRRSRLTRLDLADGKAQALKDFGEARPQPYRDLACALNGRIALRQERDQDYEHEYRIIMREPDGRWRPVSDWTEYVALLR